MKICSLLPSGTEILFALGMGDQIIGVTDLCDYPPQAREKRIVCRSKIDVSALSSDQVEEMMHQILASGESPYELDQAWLEQHPPDVVLTQDLCYFCEIDAPTVNQALKGIPVPPEVVVLQPKTLEEIFDSIRQVGQTCGAPESADNLVGELQSRVEAVRTTLAAVAQRPKVFSLEGINPLVIGGHWIPDLLETAGGRQNLYPAGCPATRLAWSEILDYEDAPIVSSDIVLSSYSGTFDSLATVTLGDRVSKTLTWYDNGWGYAHRVVDLVTRFAEIDAEAR